MMDVEEAKAWMNGERSNCNMISSADPETLQVRIAQADAASMQQAYYVLRAHDLRERRRFEAACAAPMTETILKAFGSGCPTMAGLADVAATWATIYADALLADLAKHQEAV